MIRLISAGFLLLFIIFTNLVQADPDSRGVLRFIENKGQFNEDILFYADFKGGSVYLYKDKLGFMFIDYGPANHDHFKIGESKNKETARNNIGGGNLEINGHFYTVFFSGSNTDTKVEAHFPGTEYYNYFIGNDRSKWVSRAGSFSEVVYYDIYDNIDLKIYSTYEGLKYDFIVKPGSDTDEIRLVYDGVSDLGLSEGKLYLNTSISEVVEQEPVSYDENGKEVRTKYVLNDNELTFDFPESYDRTQILTIDPLLIFSTYSGSAADNWGNTATYDPAGNLYSGGMTNHVRGGTFLGEFPATMGAFQTNYGGVWDVAILKYDSTGSDLIYATYLGGEQSEVPQSLIVNNKGELIILGVTSSIQFPVLDYAYDTTFNGGTSTTLFEQSVSYINGSDLFVVKLSPGGDKLLGSTYIGGSLNDGLINTYDDLVKNYGDQSRGDVIVDSNDNIYIASRTNSEDFPIVNGFQQLFGGGKTDALVISMNDSLSKMNWSTYYGGLGEDVALSIKLTPANDVYIAGGTNSINLPTTINTLHPLPTGNIDGYIANISSDGRKLIAATYIGTTDYDQAFQMDLDSDGNVFVVGQTRGAFPVSDGTYSNPESGQFVQKLNAQLTTSIFSTVIGSGRDEPDIYITAFLVNDCDNLYISGWGSPLLSTDRGTFFGKDYVGTNTTGMPITADAVQSFTSGSDFYLAVFTDDMSELLYATYYGSSSSFVHVDGGTSRFDKRGIVYHAVCASCSIGDSSFPTTHGAWAEENGSSGCNNAAFKFDLATLNARIRTNSPELDQPGLREGCPPFTVAFENVSVGGQIYEWDFGDGSDTVSMARDTIFHTFENQGTYQVTLKAIDSSTCAEEDVAYKIIQVTNTNFNVSNGLTICGGSVANISASGAVSYKWSPSRGLKSPEQSNPQASPDTTTIYFVYMIDKNGCESEDSVRVKVIPEIKPFITFEERSRCDETPTIDFINESENVDSYAWDFDGLGSSEEKEPSFRFDEGEHEVRVSLFNKQCVKQLIFPFNIEKLFIPNVLTPNGDGKNDTFEISSFWPVRVSIFSRYGKEVFLSEVYQNDWGGEGLPAGIYYYEITFPDFETCNGWLELMY